MTKILKDYESIVEELDENGIKFKARDYPAGTITFYPSEYSWVELEFLDGKVRSVRYVKDGKQHVKNASYLYISTGMDEKIHIKNEKGNDVVSFLYAYLNESMKGCFVEKPKKCSSFPKLDVRKMF